MKAALTVVIAVLLGLDTSPALAQQERPRNFVSAAAVLARVPEKAKEKRNPFATDPQAARAGNKLFEQHCARCHGAAAEGAKRGPSLRSEQMQKATPGEIFWILTNGVVRRGMPAWSKLPEQQRWQIVMFLSRTEQEHR